MKTQRELATLLKDYHAAKVAADKAKALGEEIKAYMVEHNLPTIEAGGFIAKYAEVTSPRFDSASFKRDHADLYAQYSKPQTSGRLTMK